MELVSKSIDKEGEGKIFTIRVKNTKAFHTTK